MRRILRDPFLIVLLLPGTNDTIPAANKGAQGENVYKAKEPRAGTGPGDNSSSSVREPIRFAT